MKPIVISNFQQGISSSPLTGIADMRNIDAQTRVGEARLNFQLQPTTFSARYGFTTVTGTATFTSSVVNIAVNADFKSTGRQVTVSAATAGFTNGATYYVIYVNSTTIKLATSYANALAGTAITSGASGTMTLTTYDLGLMKSIVYHPISLTYFGLDDQGHVWLSGSGSTNNWTPLTGNTVDGSSHGNGLAIFKNYLFVFRDYNIDVYGDLNGSPAWTNSWQTIVGGTNTDHTPLVSKTGDALYWSEYKQSATGPTDLNIGSVGLGSLIQNTGIVFAPATSSTYTFQSGSQTSSGNPTFALLLPDNQQVTGITELGANLYIGTVSYFIYPWDRHSGATATPIVMPEKNINGMVNLSNQLYISAGYRGNFYQFNGYYIQPVPLSIPTYLTNSPFNTATVNSLISHNGKIYFGLSCVGCSGVWSLNPAGGIFLEHVVSDGSYGVPNAINMGALYDNGNDDLIVSWYDRDAGIYSVDVQVISGVRYYQPSYTAYIESQFINVGTARTPVTFSTADIVLAAPLTAGQGIKIFYRKHITDTYTLGLTYDYATFTGTNNLYSIQFPFNFTDFIDAQFKIQLTTPTSSNTTPQLISVILQ